MKGDFDRARELYRRARAMLEDLGAVVIAAQTSLTSARVELLARDLKAAESELRRDYEQLLSLGELFYRPSVAVLLAQTMYAQGRLDEAEELAAAGAEIAAEDDIEPQSISRAVRAKVLARRGVGPDATRLAREAVEVLGATDDVVLRTEALLDLAEVLSTTGDQEGSRATLVEARDLCALKQMTIQRERVEELLEAHPLDSVAQRA